MVKVIQCFVLLSCLPCFLTRAFLSANSNPTWLQLFSAWLLLKIDLTNKPGNFSFTLTEMSAACFSILKPVYSSQRHSASLQNVFHNLCNSWYLTGMNRRLSDQSESDGNKTLNVSAVSYDSSSSLCAFRKFMFIFLTSHLNSYIYLYILYAQLVTADDWYASSARGFFLSIGSFSFPHLPSACSRGHLIGWVVL